MLITASAIETETNKMGNNVLISLNASLQCAELFLINTADINPTWLKTIQALLDDTTRRIGDNMDTKLQPCDYTTASKITVDDETLQMLRELTGLDRCCYDWWEMSQGVKNIVMALYLLKEPCKDMGK